MKKLKIHFIVGARPNFMKIAPLFQEFLKAKPLFALKLIHTGQHYGSLMSDTFFHDLDLPQPDAFLEVGSSSHACQTAKIMEKYELLLLLDPPDLVIVCGDVNSTLACALVAAKLNIKIAHLEAGLRSYDRTMPEEINRLLTDQLADLLFVPSPDASENLLREGIPPQKIFFVGNIMIDSLLQHQVRANQTKILSELKLEKQKYALITLHRPSNVDSEENLKTLFAVFAALSLNLKLVFPVHPRTNKNIEQFKLMDSLTPNKQLILLPPLGYLDCLQLQMNAKFILTDSGGLQEESTFFGIPCLTLRENTERPITITLGTNQLVKLERQDIENHVQIILRGDYKKGSIPPLWDGKTAARILKIVSEKYAHLS